MTNDAYLDAAKARVLEKAIVYARLKIFGTVVNSQGQVERFSSLEEKNDNIEYAAKILLSAAENLLHEMSLQVDGTTPPMEVE